MHGVEVAAMPKFWIAAAAIALMLVGRAFRAGHDWLKFLSEAFYTFALFIGGWHWGVYQHLDDDLQVATAIFSAWGMLRGSQWSVAGLLKLVELIATRRP